MKMIAILKQELSAVEDPRVIGRTRHALIDILVLGILAVICHAETWEEIEDFGNARHEWLRKFLDLPNGIPSHDTISRVFSLIEPKELELAFIDWVKRVQSQSGDMRDTICLDGKGVSGTSNSVPGQACRSCLTLVSAWSTQQGIALGQMKSNGAGNSEATAAKKLLDLLDIENMILVGDAAIGKVSVIEKIREKKGDYIFPIKADSGRHYKAVKDMMEDRANKKFFESSTMEDQGHGRKEKRTVCVLRKLNFKDDFNLTLQGKVHFKSLRAIGRVVYERELPETSPFTYVNGKREVATNPIRIETETRYFITSLKLSARGIMQKLRLQWGIENQLHWVLDVQLGEDGNKTRNRIAAENLALARKIALNLVKQDTSRRIGLKSRLKRAGWDQKYLEELLIKSHFN